MSDRRTALLLGVIAVILLTPAGIAVAQTLTHSASAGVVYETNSGVEVTLGDARTVGATPFADEQTFQDGNVTIRGSDASVEITDATYSQDPLTVRGVSVTGSLNVTRSDLGRSVTFEDGDATLFQLRDYGVDSGSEDIAYASNNGVTVTIDGLPAVGVAAVDTSTGDPLDTVSVDGSGVATFELPAGQRSVRLETTPSVLEVRNEINPDQLIDGNATLRARLFAGGDTVIERQVTNGTVSLAGVPVDEELVITVREENADFVYRRILIESAIQTSQIYLLPTNEPSAQVRFQLRDDTGRFDSDETRLFVEKPISRDFDNDGTNETEYRTISGDRIGADGEFPTILVDSERYRIRVENQQGEQRVLGSYTVQGARVSPLPIGEVTFESDVDSGAALQAGLREAAATASHDYEVRLVYVDPEARTDSIDVSITNGSGGQIRPETTEQINGSAAYVETYPITNSNFDPEQDTATVEVEATYNDGTRETFGRTLGDIPDVFQDAPISAQLLELIGLASIVAVIGLLVIVNPTIAALVGPGYAGLLAQVGLAPIPMSGVVLAGLVGVLYAVGSTIR